MRNFLFITGTGCCGCLVVILGIAIKLLSVAGIVALAAFIVKRMLGE